MFLHDHPINRIRQQNGEVTINRLWLWQPKSRNTSVFQAALIGSDSAWTIFSKQAHTDLSYDLATWQRACDGHGTTLSQTLLFSETFAICAYAEDVFAYQTALQGWEKCFSAPLEHARQTGILPVLEFVCEHGTLTIHHQRHAFWRCQKTFDGKSLNWLQAILQDMTILPYPAWKKSVYKGFQAALNPKWTKANDVIRFCSFVYLARVCRVLNKIIITLNNMLIPKKVIAILNEPVKSRKKPTI